MQQPIVGYHKDDEDHWVAKLACGHNQHVRHNPPWVVRDWVTTPMGRAAMLGHKLECKLCDDTRRGQNRPSAAGGLDSLQ